MGRRNDSRNVVLDDQGDDVSSHADTIRPFLTTDRMFYAKERQEAQAALDALLAENQQLRKREETVRGNLYLYSISELEAVETVIAIREALAGDAE